MKPPNHKTQNPNSHATQRGFTLMETVIAILVLAVLLTGFLTVFTPAAQGIRRSISTQQADRLQATLERDMSTLRTGETVKEKTTSFVATTGFDKAFIWIEEGNVADTAIFIYQYRAWNPSSTLSDPDKPAASENPRDDGTLYPMTNIVGKPGIDYITQTAARRVGDLIEGQNYFEDDIEAIVGPLFYVIPTQLVQNTNELKLGTKGVIQNTPPIVDPYEATAKLPFYNDAVIPFSAAFFMTPSASAEYLKGQKFKKKFNLAAASKVKPVFTRNLAVRR